MYLAMRMGRPLCWPRSQKWPYFSYPRPTVVVTSASTSAFELAHVGCTIVLIGTADNQRGIYDAFAQSNSAVLGGFQFNGQIDIRKVCSSVFRLWADKEVSRHLGEKARCTIDGNGASRVAQQMMARGQS